MISIVIVLALDCACIFLDEMCLLILLANLSMSQIKTCGTIYSSKKKTFVFVAFCVFLPCLLVSDRRSIIFCSSR